MTSSSETRQLTRRVPEDVANGRDLDLLDELFAEDVVEHSVFGQELHGLDEFRANMEDIFEGFSDFEVVVEDLVAEGDTAAMRVTLSGTHDGSYMGIEPTGKRFEVGQMVFTRVADGRIVERWVQPDSLGMLQQLGISVEDVEPAAAPADD